MNQRSVVLAVAIFLLIAAALTATLVYVRQMSSHLQAELAHIEEEVHAAKTAALKASAAQIGSVATKNTAPFAVVSVMEHDFGNVRKEDGAVSTVFSITNNGEGVLIIGELSTSCGCTSATTDRHALAQGESAAITVVFDPNVHEEPQEKFSRMVYVPTNDPENTEITLTISVDIDE